MKNPRRVVVLSMATVWVVGSVRSSGDGAAVVDGMIGRTVGVMMAALLLSVLAGPAPELAAGIALIAATATVIGNAAGVVAWSDRVTVGARSMSRASAGATRNRER